MLYEESREPVLREELFRTPTSAYRGTPFWSWNCRVTKELIREQMEIFRKMGFGGAHLHPRTGLENEYLGEEFLDLVKYADEQAKERDMLCWLYDEDRYPSGAAGGIVTENWDYRARHLLLTRERKENMCASREAFRESIARGEKPAGYYLAAYRVQTRDGYLVSYRQIQGACPEWDSREETREEGRLWLAYVELMRESPWYNDQTYVDVMNQEATRRFLEVTHERYFQVLGEEFGRSIPAIFTDEPQIKGSMALPDGESGADVTLSYTDDLSDTYRARYGVELLAVLPELLWELPEGKHSVHRYQYHDHLAERFVSAYCDTIAKWCGEHGIAMTGHYMSEPTLYSQTLRLGEAMRCYRNQQLPGVDILCGDPEYSTVKQAVSVARQNGREGVLSELYGVTHWDFDFKGHKLQGDWQAALGVTIRCHHLAYMSMEGESKRDWPASIHYQSPWWEQYHFIEDYFARMNTALTRGKAVVDVAVVHPVESYWMCYGPVAQTGALRAQLDENFKNLINWLLFGLVDFDFLSESLLPGQCELEGWEETGPESQKEAGAKEARLQVGEMAYRTVLVPGMLTIRSSTLDRLEQFAHRGGRVIFLGGVPEYVDGKEDVEGRAKKLAEETRVIPYEQYALLEALQADRQVEIRLGDGSPSRNLFYQMRQDGDCRWLFVCHVNRKRNRVDQAEHLTVRIQGSYQILSYNGLDGSIGEVQAAHRNGCTYVELQMYAEDSFLWKLTPVQAETYDVECTMKSRTGKAAGGSTEEKAGIRAGGTASAGTEETLTARMAEAGPEPEKPFQVPTGRLQPYGLVAGSGMGSAKPVEILQTIYEPMGFELEEPNVLLLDRAQWKLNQEPWESGEEILRLDNAIRSRLGYPHRQDAYTQPWRIKEAPERDLVTLRYRIDARIQTQEVFLAMERPEKAAISWNGQVLPRPEDREEEGYFVDSFIRKVRLPGLRAGINELVLEIPYGRKTNLENIFLLGDFGVEVRGTSAAVIEKPERLYFGEIATQGMPFYGGSLGYIMECTLREEEAVCIRVPHFKAPVLGVRLDGEDAGRIAFAPHVLSLGVCKAGVHRLEIRAYGNRFNSFGTLHNSNDEYQWYGPDSYRTGGYEWSEDWMLRPFGVMSRVEVCKEFLSGQEGV